MTTIRDTIGRLPASRSHRDGVGEDVRMVGVGIGVGVGETDGVGVGEGLGLGPSDITRSTGQSLGTD